MPPHQKKSLAFDPQWYIVFIPSPVTSRVLHTFGFLKTKSPISGSCSTEADRLIGEAD